MKGGCSRNFSTNSNSKNFYEILYIYLFYPFFFNYQIFNIFLILKIFTFYILTFYLSLIAIFFF